MLPKVLVIVGPTASGKSDLAVKLARQFNGEVISADSRQVYKGFDLTSGKITKSEMRGIPHYMLSVTSPKKTYSVDFYKKEAEKYLRDILNRKKLPVIAGGSGLYIDSLVFDKKLPDVPPNIILRKKLEKLSNERLFDLLMKLDKRRAREIDISNPRRMIRSIEIARALGKVPHLASGTPSAYNALWIGLNPSFDKLRSNISDRIKIRIKKGMVAEVKNLHKEGLSFKKLEKFGLEFKYVSLYLQNKITKKEMIHSIKGDSLKYAKRQMTWFKRNKEIHWLTSPQDSTKLVKRFLD